MAAEYLEENGKRWSDVCSHISRLVDEIPTDEILSYLGNCLSDRQMRKFQRRLENNANAFVNVELLQALRYHEYWWKHLTNALICIRKDGLLTLMGWSTEPYDQESIGLLSNASVAPQMLVHHLVPIPVTASQIKQDNLVHDLQTDYCQHYMILDHLIQFLAEQAQRQLLI